MLTNTRKYKHVFLRTSKPLTELAMEQNVLALLKMIPDGEKQWTTYCEASSQRVGEPVQGLYISVLGMMLFRMTQTIILFSGNLHVYRQS